ncbi:RluA family pseudouridine synthase [Clostridium fermenticellae]|uniref:Pseudouridine synthase n=1 Tax=Clostridium fermenticellae TaxID=2068654 RepID=A0A386H5S7_9CLOT|nr:RluA family pseudouridine synthase [Clostridium fermenticellae]AYD41006.1 RluA family pseudouridine synthase [Clostridium fermenticellae]
MKENSLIFEVDGINDGMKLRQYLKTICKLSSRLIKSAALNKRIKINNKVEKLNYIIEKNDRITVDLPENEDQDIVPEKMDIDVVYEDMDILVVNKKPNMVVHPTKSYQSGTLANGILYYFRENGEQCIVRLVNRLDMNTSGLIIVAKNQFSHMALSRDMHGDNFEKSYLAVVHGNLTEKSGIIDLPIYRQGEGNIKRIVDERGQRSVTCYEVIESFNHGDLVKLSLKTGRTHQIRVHMSHIGYPIYGDDLYCDMDDTKCIKRQALHAYKLRFPHPRTGKKLNFEIDLPMDIKNLIQKIKF